MKKIKLLEQLLNTESLLGTTALHLCAERAGELEHVYWDALAGQSDKKMSECKRKRNQNEQVVKLLLDGLGDSLDISTLRKEESLNTPLHDLVVAALEGRRSEGFAREPGQADLPHLRYEPDQSPTCRMTRLLLRAGVNPEEANADNKTPEQLLNADNALDLRGLRETFQQERARKIVLESDPRLGIRNDDGLPGLHLACQEHDLPEVGRQIARGARINSRDLQNYTAMMTAAESGVDPDITGMLLEQNPDLLVRNNYGDTILHAAVAGGNAESMEKIVEAAAQTLSRSEFLEWCNCAHKGGDVPVHSAIENGNSDALEILIHAGADLELENSSGIKPLRMTVEAKNEHMARLLLEGGADPNAPLTDPNQDLILHVAIFPLINEKSVAFASMLLEAGAQARNVLELARAEFTRYEDGTLETGKKGMARAKKIIELLENAHAAEKLAPSSTRR